MICASCGDDVKEENESLCKECLKLINEKGQLNNEDSITSAVYQVGIGVEFFFDECAIDTRSDIPEIGQCELDPIWPIYTGYSITLRGGDVFSDYEDIPYVNVMITKRF
jgi:hypothetical protein